MFIIVVHFREKLVLEYVGRVISVKSRVVGELGRKGDCFGGIYRRLGRGGAERVWRINPGGANESVKWRKGLTLRMFNA
jgi:hypothetical protein